MATAMLSDADLHGLVDGHLDPHRRADALRRAAASPRDRALIEAWQDQNDLIRAAFAGVEREPLPSSLDLRTRPQLHAVPLSDPSPAVPKSGRRRRLITTAAILAAMATGLAGSWYVTGLPVETGATASASNPEERQLADRTIAALAFGESAAPTPVGAAEPPPTTSIPDLSAAGFVFTGAEARGISPKSLIFRYRNADDERVAIGAIRASDGDDTSPVRHEAGFTWRSGRVAYAIFGTVAPERLRALATTLRADVEAQ